ncbi:MAG TPA: ChrR family anti-sigma-E factor [Rhizomicrobium sp.]|jgi:putative transcriptional regulator
MSGHHPSADCLADYARGSLREGAMLVVACHTETCERCRQEAGLLENLGGVLLEEVAPTALSSGALQRAMARLDASPSGAAAGHALPRFLDGLGAPRALADKTIGSRRWATPNIWFAPVRMAGETASRTYLVCGRSNARIPLHAHGGLELTQVLWGSFSDPSGTYARGDFVAVREDTQHALFVTGSSPCLCLIDSDTPMRLASYTARLLQTLLGQLY